MSNQLFSAQGICAFGFLICGIYTWKKYNKFIDEINYMFDNNVSKDGKVSVSHGFINCTEPINNYLSKDFDSNLAIAKVDIYELSRTKINQIVFKRYVVENNSNWYLGNDNSYDIEGISYYDINKKNIKTDFLKSNSIMFNNKSLICNKYTDIISLEETHSYSMIELCKSELIYKLFNCLSDNCVRIDVKTKCIRDGDKVCIVGTCEDTDLRTGYIYPLTIGHDSKEVVYSYNYKNSGEYKKCMLGLFGSILLVCTGLFLATSD